MSYYFTSEAVSAGHPDKVADQISDAILDECLRQDANSHVACETLVTTGQCIIAGEITTDAYVDVQGTARDIINKIGYNNSDLQFSGDSCGVLSAIHEQSPDIAMGVNKTDEKDQGAGDQGMMFGYAVKYGVNYMPVELSISRAILQTLDKFRKDNVYTFLRPDAKAQVTVRYNEDNMPVKVEKILVSTQHSPDATQELLKKTISGIINDCVINNLPVDIQKLFVWDSEKEKYIYDLYVNPTGQFIIGGPAGDTGLTGRKIIVDTYGGHCPHGGGAFSGKDPSKVDRSAAYMCRYVAKNLVAAGVCDECTIQVSYGIGMKEPMSVFVDTHNTNHTIFADYDIAIMIQSIFDFTPYGITKTLKLKNPIYLATASYGPFGHDSYIENGIEYFTWEKLDKVDEIRTKFNIK